MWRSIRNPPLGACSRNSNILPQAATATASVAPDGVRYAPPVLRPGKIVCVGLNYADHIAESRTAKPDRIVLFAKFPSCLVGHGDAIRYPAITTELDYEGELAVVIGRQARNVPVESALDFHLISSN